MLTPKNVPEITVVPSVDISGEQGKLYPANDVQEFAVAIKSRSTCPPCIFRKC